MRKPYKAIFTSRNLVVFLVVVTFGSLGTYLHDSSRASTLAVSSEAESGSVTGKASVGISANASGGNYVHFGSVSGMAPPAGYTSSQLTFDDNFSGTTLNSTKWNNFMTSRAANGWPWNDSYVPAGDSAVSPPGGNHLDYFAPNQISVNDGLNLTLVPDTSVSGYSYVSGTVTSYNKFQFSSGYVQFKVKMPGDLASGGWSSLWFLPGPGGSGGDRGEIDLFEGGFTPTDAGLPSTVPENQVFNSHYLGPNTSWQQAGYNTGVDMSAGYHIYGMEYKPGVSIKTFFDGHMVANFTNDINTDPYEIIIGNNAASSLTNGWHSQGPVTSPAVMSIAQVQVYQ